MRRYMWSRFGGDVLGQSMAAAWLLQKAQAAEKATTRTWMIKMTVPPILPELLPRARVFGEYDNERSQLHRPANSHGAAEHWTLEPVSF